MMGDQAGPKGAGKAKKAMKKWRPVGRCVKHLISAPWD